MTADVRANSFDLLRLVAAFTVLVEHSWVLLGDGYPVLPESSGTTIGGVGLGIFFLTSGYLILDSWLADPSPRRFVARRALRIAPLFALVVLVSALVLGPLLTTLTADRYFSDAGTWGYIGSNLALYVMDFELPGVFTDAPFSGAVNGALWTIPVEVLCYLGILALGVAGIAARRWLVTALAVVPVGLLVAIELSGYDGTVIPRLLATNGVPLVAFFAVGMVVRSVGPGWRPPWMLTAVVLLAWLYSWDGPAAGVLAIVTISLVTLTVAFAAPAALHHPTGRNDLSYGVYVLSYPVQQVLIELGVGSAPLVLLLTVLIVAPLALLSWRYVERPMLRLKPRRPRPIDESAQARTEPLRHVTAAPDEPTIVIPITGGGRP